MEAKAKKTGHLATLSADKQAELGRKGAEKRILNSKIAKIEELAQRYYNKQVELGYPPTSTGLAKALRFDNRFDLIKASEGDGEIAKAYRRALQGYDEALERMALGSKNSVGAIFLLKNRGFKDTQEVHTENKNISLTLDASIKDIVEELRKDK